ncbi:hypothetical protein D3C76_771600 [compost metagenome]
MKTKPGTHSQRCDEQEPNEPAYLVILDQGTAIAPQCRNVQGEWQAAQNHDRHCHPVNRWLRPVPKRGVRRGESSGGDQRHGVVDRFKWRHSSEPKRHSADAGKAQVEQKNVLGGDMGTRCHFLRPIRGLCLEQTHAAYSQQWKDRHSHADKTDASQPMQHGAPYQQAGRRGIKTCEYGRASGRDARHRFKECVGVADIADEHHRQCCEGAHNYPACRRQQVHIPGTKLASLRTPPHDQQEATDESNQTRPEKCRQIVTTLIGHQCDHGKSHADGQRDQENAQDEADKPNCCEGHDSSVPDLHRAVSDAQPESRVNFA